GRPPGICGKPCADSRLLPADRLRGPDFNGAIGTTGPDRTPPGAPHHILRSTLMNKFAKGSVAAGAGLVLLLGGAGTLAYWNDSAELANGSIHAVNLKLEADNDLLAASIAEQPALWVSGGADTVPIYP